METLANMIPSTQTWAIVKAICDVLSFVMSTCVVNQHCGYWLLSNALTFAIKLYVKNFKEKLELQIEIDAIEDMDTHMKVKQLNINMQKQVTIVLRPFLDFMYSFNPTKLTIWLNKSMIKGPTPNSFLQRIVIRS
jgi:hypothetical protein